MGRSSQTTTQSVPAFYEQFLSQEVFPTASEIAGQEFTPYEGQFTAGVSPLSMGAQTQFQQVADIASMTPQDYAAMTQGNFNPFQEQVIDAALARSQRERDIARTGEMADITRAGAFGNERRGVYEAERQAAFDLGQQEMIANLMQQGYNQAQAQTMAQLGMGQQAALAGAQGMMQLGNLEQMTQQAELDALYQEFLREQNLPLQQLGALTAASSGAQVPVSTTETSRPGFTGILGAIGSLGQGLGAMDFSDRRLKRNVQHVATENGIRYYRWEWNEEAKRIGASDTPPMGVIAQELVETHPHLVHTGDDGYMRVDYAGLANEQGKVA